MAVMFASARQNENSKLEIILPSDFPTVMMRTVFVSKDAPHSEVALAFLRHLIKLQSTDASQRAETLPPLASAQDNTSQSTIALEPALMTYLDKLKRQTFIKEWESAIIH